VFYSQLKSLHERQAELLELQRKSEDNEGLNNQRMANGSSALASEASLDNTLTANTLRGDNFAIGRKQTNIPSDEDKDMDEREEVSLYDFRFSCHLWELLSFLMLILPIFRI